MPCAAIYAEIGRTRVVDDQPEGSGIDAAFAALKAQAPSVERFGLPGFGAHTANNEWVTLNAIEPRLYLAAPGSGTAGTRLGGRAQGNPAGHLRLVGAARWP
jgi:hypothetical protein